MTTDALGTAGGVVSAQDHRLAITAMLTGLSTGALDARTGVFPGPNSLALLTGTSTTAPMTVSVAAFQAVTARTSASGAYLGPTVEAPTTVNIAAAPGANSRIDVVWVKQQDADATVPTPDGTTAPLVSVTAGTAAASPTKPAIPVGALELGTVTVAAGATSTNAAGVTIANTARQTVASGGVLPVRAGDATPGAYDGQYRDNPSFGWIERWSSSLGGWFRPAVPIKPGRRLAKAGTQSLSANTWTAVTWDNAADTPAGTGMWASGQPTRLTATKAGRWAITVTVGGSVTNLQVRSNSAGSSSGGTMLAGASVAAGAGNLSTEEVTLAAGDYIEAFAFNTSAASIGAVGGYTASMSLSYIDAA